jgi:glycosyltransferase involved in cell wall biosynthesis
MPPHKRLLIITYDFPPEIAGARRVTKFCEFLPEHGIQPTVLTTQPFAATGYDPEPILRLQERGVEIIRVDSLDLFVRRYQLRSDWQPTDPPPPWLTPRSLGLRLQTRQARGPLRWLARQARRWMIFPDDRSGWIAPAARAAETWLRANPNAAMMTTSFPNSAHMVGLKVKRRMPSVPWIADFRDGWTQNGEFYNPPTAWHANRHKSAEQAVAHLAHFVFAVSAPIADHLHKIGQRPPGSTAVIYNGFDEGDLTRAADAAKEILDKRLPDDPPTLVYTGTLFGKRSAEALLKAIAQLRAEGRACRMDLFSRLKPAEARLIEFLDLRDRVAIHGFVPHLDALAEQMAAHLLVLVVEPGPQARIMMTQKVFEYMGTGRPILAIVPPESACAEMLQKVGGAYFAKPDDPQSIAGALRDALGDLAAGKARQPNPEVAARYSRRNQVAKAAQFLDKLWRAS